MNEYGHNEFVNERLAEHERRTLVFMAQADARAAIKAEAAESCGAWCQVKRHTYGLRPAFSHRA